MVKIHILLARRGVAVPHRTLHRFAVERCGYGRRTDTVRVADGEPGVELQVDFGKMGLIPDPATGRHRVTYALIFTACYSRHCFVWLTYRQTTEAVIAGFEAAWAFFGGVFTVVIPDNMAPIVVDGRRHLSPASPTRSSSTPRPGVRDRRGQGARRRPTSPGWSGPSPMCAGISSPARPSSIWADAQRRVEQWCRTTAGMRVHGTTQLHPAEVFAAEEQPVLLPAPEAAYDLPSYPTPKVHRDRHIEVDKAIYSVPGELIGQRVEVRADSKLIKVFWRGQLIKVHPRVAPGRRQTDPGDLPSEKTAYAMRDIDHLRRLAANEGAAIGVYADELLGGPLPWTKMRQVYRLLGLVKKWGADRVDTACAKALEAETVNVGLIERMIERATESTETRARAGQRARRPLRP